MRAPADRVFDAARELDLGATPLIRILLRLRGLRARGRGLAGLRDAGFVLLEEDPPRELVLGLVGRFWTPGGDVQRVDPAGFLAFERPGFAKVAWNLRVEPRAGGALLATETRILCLDARSRRRFRLYWMAIRFGSGLIRREMLRAIREQAERAP